MRGFDRDNDRSRQLCAVLGHELRNPLAAAITRISVAAAMMDSPQDPRAVQLSGALAELERVSALLTTYLEFGRGCPVARRPLDLIDVVQAVVSRSPSTRLELRVDRAPVRGDADLLGRAIENMLENAYQAGATEVVIRVDQQAEAVVVDIDDNGPGVPSTLRDSLFDPFVSGRGSSGLGLAVARDVIEQQGGRLSMVAAGRRGTTFEIVLPLDENVPLEAPLASFV